MRRSLSLSATAASPQTYTGRARDIDFIHNSDWVQVTISSTNPDLIAVTKDARLEAVILSSVVLKREVEVQYDEQAFPKGLLSAKLVASPPGTLPAQQQGDQVEWIRFDDAQSQYKARISGATGGPVELLVPDPRA